MTVVEISKKNLIHNLQQFRKRVGKRIKIMAVVKANAYGHGLLEVGKIVSQNGADGLGVNALEEGLKLRQAGIKLPILVMGYLPFNSLNEAIKNSFSFVVYNPETIKKINQITARFKKKARVHLKIETGTNRQGIKITDLEDFVKLCLRSKNIIIEGVYTHYANIEDTLDHTFALGQLKKFKKALQLIRQVGEEPLSHTACSAAIILYPQTYFDMIRLGISLYGLWPSREVKILASRSRKKIELKPVLSWRSIIAQVKQVPKGETVGYGRTFRANREMKIAISPVGYWDGYDRKLSNCGRVLIKGQFAPVVGRICMNMFMVDASEIPNIKPEEEVVLIGKQEKNEITVNELAEKIGTINYEVITRINPLIPRKVV